MDYEFIGCCVDNYILFFGGRGGGQEGNAIVSSQGQRVCFTRVFHDVPSSIFC